MALKLNIYRTIPGVTTATATVVYTAPTGYTGVVLLGNIANIGASVEKISVWHRREATDTAIVENFPIPGEDATNVISGKLFLQSGDSLVIQGSTDITANPGNLEYLVSILETLN